MQKILAVDDDLNFLKSLSNLLTYKEFKVEITTDTSQALSYAETNHLDCILLDVKMPNESGLSLLEKIQTQNPQVPIIMISGESNYEDVVLAIKKGAYDFIEKPLNAERLLITLRNALEKKVWYSERKQLLNQIDSSMQMVGESNEFKILVEQIEILSKTNAKVLIEGESGTGKELVAWALHFKGNRSSAPFIKLNCAAIPSELLESELFGHKKGSFTGAINDYDGKFIQANNGTLFLDEIGDMDLNLQSKVLRALQEEEIERIGDSKSQKIDIRIITATNKNLQQLIKEGKFRRDLYHRINVVKIKVPTLSSRKDDIRILSRFFLQQFAETYNKKVSEFSPSAMSLLLQYDWPGNVRELKNVIEKITIFTNNSVIQANEVSHAMGMKFNVNEPSIEEDNTLADARNSFEMNYIINELDKHNWRIVETAQCLGIDRSALFKKMRKYGIKKE